MKKNFLSVFIICFCVTAFSQEIPQKYKIFSATYFMNGVTKEYALKTEVKIDFEQIFYSEESLMRYINDINTKLHNLRQLESVTLRTVYLDPQNDIIPVVILITTKDTWNIFPLPYPKYTSDNGLDLKIKLKDYNFLGTLNTLSGEIAYKMDEDNDHFIGAGLSFDFPFGINNIDASWNNSIDLYYMIGGYFKPSFSTGLAFSVPLGKHYFNFGFSQGFNYDPKEYPEDGPYFSENVYFNFPLQIANIDNWGKVNFVPGVSFTLNWGSRAFTDGWDGIVDSDLKGPVISPSYSISTSRVDWVNNYRNGASFSFSQSFAFNFHEMLLKPGISFEVAAYKAFKYGSISGRVIWKSYLNDTFDVGDNMRGIRDDRVEPQTAFIFNFDAPIKVFQTNWVKWGLWEWTKYLDFELQLSPFIDAAITFDQGNYLSGGLEVLVFPTKMRSIIVRASIGFEAFPWEGFSKLLKKNEIYIGIGLFY